MTKNNFVNIWAWSLMISPSSPPVSSLVYRIGRHYLVQQTSTQITQDNIIHLKRFHAGKYLIWMERKVQGFHYIRICSHSEYYSNGECK